MSSAIKRVKTRLSHVDGRSWHYRLFTYVWEKRSQEFVSKKACTYYWFYIPSSFVALGILGVVAGFIWTIGLFCGFRPKIKYDPTDPGVGIFYPYKRTKDGRKRHIAPWEVAASVTAVVSVYIIAHWLADNLHVLKIIGITFVLLFTLGVFMYCFVKGWTTPLVKETRSVATQSIARWWNRACPTLVVESREETRR